MNTQFDTPNINDNRNYNYTDFSTIERLEYSTIMKMIEKKSTVIDLGCGNGSLLEKLIREKEVIGCGMESSKTGVETCKEKGLHVAEGRIDEPLPFSDNSFDYAICNVTIQMVMYPEVLIQEMKRIAQYQIISFPNFAFYRNRLDMLMYGRMPKSLLFGYQWYSTGHIHQLSIKDFLQLIEVIGELQIIQRYHCQNNSIKKMFEKINPNLFQMIPIYLLKKTKCLKN